MVKRWWTLTLMAAGILLGNGLGSDRPAIARLDDEARCVIFYEGNDCTQDRSSCCTEAGAGMGGCWKNDEARSMKLHGPAGTLIAVFDDPKASTSDDYFVLTKEIDEPICVGSFDHSAQLLSGTRHHWFYSGGNGLDGKVSTFRWHDPRSPAAAPF